MKVLKTFRGDPAGRQCAEAVYIRKTPDDLSMNSKNEYIQPCDIKERYEDQNGSWKNKLNEKLTKKKKDELHEKIRERFGEIQKSTAHKMNKDKMNVFGTSPSKIEFGHSLNVSVSTDITEENEWSVNARNRNITSDDDTNIAAASKFSKVKDKPVTPAKLKSQIIPMFFPTNDKIDFNFNAGNKNETDSCPKTSNFPCYKVARKVSQLKKSRTKSRLKPKFRQNSLQCQSSSSSPSGSNISKFFVKL